MAYTLGNKCAKNLCKRTVLLQLVIENVVTFFGTQCIFSDFFEVYFTKGDFNHRNVLKLTFQFTSTSVQL